MSDGSCGGYGAVGLEHDDRGLRRLALVFFVCGTAVALNDRKRDSEEEDRNHRHERERFLDYTFISPPSEGRK